MNGEARQIVRAYHRRSKHCFDAYAPGPGTLDWDAQPAPFRHFDGADNIALPTLDRAMRNPPLAAALHRLFSVLTKPAPPAETGPDALGVLLQLSLGITAWKSCGPDRWAVRANPSSGNLHPIEAYLFLRGVAGLADGLYHYCPDSHALECRAEFDRGNGPPQIFAALSSVMWREAWKYGERAFRYCQLDTGHAVGALRYAAALLGWPIAEQCGVGTDTLARWLGLHRIEDFTAGRHPHTEREEAEILLSLVAQPDLAWLGQVCTTARWHGKASAIDLRPMYRWPAIDEAATASRHADRPDNHDCAGLPPAPGTAFTHACTPDRTAVDIILHRRSAQRFDSRHVMPTRDFYALLEATLPPCDATPPPRIGLVLFVHRVADLESGLYLLPRSAYLAGLLDACLDARFLRRPVADAPPHLGLQLLAPMAPAELYRTARGLHCHQDIAAHACFALGMLAEFDTAVAGSPAAYRSLFREAGMIGQALYLHAEAWNLRGTGIGCYFDDPFHELLGLRDECMQSVYHFTVGLPLDDPRIETVPGMKQGPRP